MHPDAPSPAHAYIESHDGGWLTGGPLVEAWIALHPDEVRSIRAGLTDDQIDTFIELPVRSLAVQLAAELAVLNHRDLTLFACPGCELLMGRVRQVPVDEHWTEWQCWDCGHVFGVFADYGTLDIGADG